MSDLLSKPMAQLALNQAEKISRVTNMSLTLVREALGTIGTDPEGLNVMLGLASMIEERQLSISELADKAAAKIRNPDSPELKNFDYVAEVSNLKQEWGEKMEDQLSTILTNAGKAPGAAAPEAEKTAVSPEDRALVGKPFAQGSKIIRVEPNGRVLVERADGQQGTVPREAVDRWLQEQGGETAPEGEPQGSPSAEGPEGADNIKSEMKEKFPKLAQFAEERGIDITEGEGPNHAETFLKGEGESPNPDKDVIQIRETPFNKAEVAAAETLHILGGTEPDGKTPVNPEFFKMKQDFLKNLSPKEKEFAKEKFEKAKAEGATGTNFASLDNFIQSTHGDGFIRMHLFPQLMNEEEDRKRAESLELLTEPQKQILSKMKEFIGSDQIQPEQPQEQIEVPGLGAVTPESLDSTIKIIQADPRVPQELKELIGQLGKQDVSETPDLKPRTPAKKDVAKKPGKFTDAEAVAGLDDEAFERFISTTPASKRSANVNKVVADRIKAQLRSKSGEAEKDFSTPAKVKKMIPKVTKGTAEQTKIFKALVDQESGSRVGLTSKAGAKGLAQIMPGTAKLIAEKSGLGFTKEQILTDPEANLKAGFWLLFKDTFPRFKKTDDQLAFSLADYNANPSLRKARAKLKGKDKNTWSKVEPMLPSETRAYVKSIKKRMGK
jgi:soluble lytic murein transglycosylase-like protein